MDPQKDYPFAERLKLQDLILDNAIEEWASVAHHTFVSDRTPLDMLAYTMADIQRKTLTVVERAEFKLYMDRCFKVTNWYFSVLVVHQPGIPYVDDPTKGPPCMGYIEHINTLITGLVADRRCHAERSIIPREVLDLERRVGAVNSALRRAVTKFSAEQANGVTH